MTWRLCPSRVRAAAIAMVVVGCGFGCGAKGPRPAETTKQRRGGEACDPEMWNAVSREKQRAWLASAVPPAKHSERPVENAAEREDRPVIVAAIEDDVRVASMRDGVIVARWVAPTALGRAAMAEIGVSAKPGEPPDSARTIRIGHPLPATGGEWLALREVDGLAVEGVVPARVRGTIWEESAAPRSEPMRSMFEGVIRAEPSADAPLRARTKRSALRTDRPVLAPPGWAAVIAETRYAVVRGFVELPPPRPPPPPRADAGTEVEIDYQPEPGPFAPGTCVYDAPGGNVVGMVLEEHPLSVEPAPTPGWYRFTLLTPWGRAAYYTRTAPRPPPPPPEEQQPFTWPATDDWSRELR